MAEGGTDEVEVVHEPDDQRFVVLLAGSGVGFTEYRSGADGARVFFHTEIDPAFEGRGLASRLISGALDATRDGGLQVVAECPFVRAYVRRHPDDYRDIVVSPPL